MDAGKQKRTFKSFRYTATTTWGSARRGTLTAAPKAPIAVGSPPEFRGEAGVWSPEELLVGSLNTCLMLTFLTLAQAKGLTPAEYVSDAEGLVENVDGKYRVTQVAVKPRVVLRSESEIEAARKVMDGVEAQCFISNSLTAKVTLHPEFAVAPGR